MALIAFLAAPFLCICALGSTHTRTLAHTHNTRRFLSIKGLNALAVLRMLRVFRVLRLIKRIDSLNIIFQVNFS
jgi:hypothetical protein